MKIHTLRALLERQEAKKPTVLLTNIRTGQQRLVHTTDELTGELKTAVPQAIRADKPVSLTTEDGDPLFLNVFNPPLRLIIVGAVHIAQPLVKMASLAGYEVFIVDPREAFATAERFPNQNLSHQWPDEALQELQPDSRTAIVVLSHDPKIDDPALNSALKSQSFYIGALGSKKTHAARVKRLTKAGFSDLDIARVHGPVGLSIGAKSPAEIAVSVIAEMTEALRQPKNQSKYICAIVLAAGLSQRMGKTNKLLADFGGRPMIRHVVKQVLESDADEVRVVVGHQADEVCKALEGLDVKTVENTDYQEGLSASLRAGLRSLPDFVDGALICLGDMPLVSKTLINSLTDNFDPSQDRSICVPVYEGTPGNPILWASQFFPEMLDTSGDTGARHLLEHHPNVIVEVPQAHEAALVDIDTEEDMVAVRDK